MASAIGENSRPPSAAAEAVVIEIGSIVEPKWEKSSGHGDLVLDVREWGSDAEKLCRICHLSSGCGGSAGSRLIRIGCGCKGELGSAHRDCSEAWFRIKGNRSCEICGMNAKNITGDEDSIFMEEWREGRMLDDINDRNSSARVSCWKRRPFCNFLVICLAIAFMLPWFLRVKIL